jgi:uncharacterized membrane protein HdeD (DUF308 family)
MRYDFLLAWPLVIAVSVGGIISFIIGFWFIPGEFNMYVIIGMFFLIVICVMGIILSHRLKTNKIGE